MKTRAESSARGLAGESAHAQADTRAPSIDGSRPWLRRTPISAILAGVSAVIFATSIWMLLTSRWYPMQDLGAHIEMFDVVGRFHDSATTHDLHYVRSFVFAPNVLTLWLARVFVPLCGARFYANALVLIAVVALPPSLAYLARSAGRSQWLSVFGFALVHNSMLYFGLLNWVLGLPIYFVLVGLAIRVSQRDDRLERVCLTSLLASTFLVHGLLWVLAVPTVGLILLLRWRTLRDVAADALTILPAFLILVPWLLSKRSGGQPFGPQFESVVSHLDHAHRDALGVLNTTLDNWVSIVLLCCGACLILIARSVRNETRTSSAGADSSQPSYENMFAQQGLFAALSVSGLGFLLLPAHFDLFSIVSQRMLIPFLGVAVVAIPLRRVDLRSVVILLVVEGTAMAFHVELIRQSHAFNEDWAEPLEEIISELPDGVGLSIAGPWYSDASRYWMNHTARGIHSVVNGGYSNGGFAAAPTVSVEYAENLIPPVPASRAWTDDDLSQFPYVLVRGASEKRGALLHERLSLFVERGNWSIMYADPMRLTPSRYRYIGGRGGSLQEFKCGLSGVQGLDMRAEDGRLTKFSVRCHPGLSPDAAEEPAGADSSVSCAEGVAIGIYGRSKESWVTSIGLLCRNSAEELTQSPSIGFEGAGGFRYQCQNDELITSVRARSGNWLDAVTIECGSEILAQEESSIVLPSPGSGKPASADALVEPVQEDGAAD